MSTSGNYGSPVRTYSYPTSPIRHRHFLAQNGLSANEQQRDTAIEILVKTSVNTSVYSRVPAELSLWPLGQNVLAESPVCLTLLGLSTICLESAPFVFFQFVVFERFTLDLSLGPSFVH